MGRSTTLEIQDFIGDWRDTFGHDVWVGWSRPGNRGGQLDVQLRKPGRNRDPIKLNVKDLGNGRFACGHYDLDIGESHRGKIVWLDHRNPGRRSIWNREDGGQQSSWSQNEWKEDRRGDWKDDRHGGWKDDRHNEWKDDRRGDWANDRRGNWNDDRRDDWKDDRRAEWKDDRGGGYGETNQGGRNDDWREDRHEDAGRARRRGGESRFCAYVSGFVSAWIRTWQLVMRPSICAINIVTFAFPSFVFSEPETSCSLSSRASCSASASTQGAWPQVPEVYWASDRELKGFPAFAKQTFDKHRSPVVFRGVPLDQWGAWSSLARKPEEVLEELIAVADPTIRPKVGNVSLFQYFDSRKQEVWKKKWGVDVPPTTWTWDLDSTPAQLRQLLHASQEDRRHQHGYWILRTDDIPSMDEALRRASPSMKDLFGSPWLGSPGPATRKPLSEMNVNAWLASPGIAMNAHFDAHWNYLVHVHGPKRALLASPQEMLNLAMYPRLHPGVRSSPVDLRLPWSSLTADFPLIANASFMEVDLQAGDVLLIPPMWVHFIHIPEGPEPSFTLSFFSDCPESEMMRAKQNAPENSGVAISRALTLMEEFFKKKGVARKFVKQRILSRSFRSIPEYDKLFCAGKRNLKLSGACSAPAQLPPSDQTHAIARLVKSLHKDVNLMVLQAHVEDLLMDVFGPMEACAALERCILPLLSKSTQ